MDTIEIPKIANTPGIYIFYFAKDGKEVPFYVGQTRNLRRRMGEYIISSWVATTDFIVGEAIKYLQENSYGVMIRFWSASEKEEERKLEEQRKIDKFQREGHQLLNRSNTRVGYNYRVANQNEIRDRIRKEVDEILRENKA